VLDTKFFTPELRFDSHYVMDFNQPIGHSISGSFEAFRSGEVQMEQASVGGDFRCQNVRGRSGARDRNLRVAPPPVLKEQDRLGLAPAWLKSTLLLV
jgi:hypothetical protein